MRNQYELFVPLLVEIPFPVGVTIGRIVTHSDAQYDLAVGFHATLDAAVCP